jgi:hypothetical protein
VEELRFHNLEGQSPEVDESHRFGGGRMVSDPELWVQNTLEESRE